MQLATCLKTHDHARKSSQRDRDLRSRAESFARFHNRLKGGYAACLHDYA
jgi:hypothetical protein